MLGRDGVLQTGRSNAIGSHPGQQDSSGPEWGATPGLVTGEYDYTMDEYVDLFEIDTETQPIRQDSNAILNSSPIRPSARTQSPAPNSLSWSYSAKSKNPPHTGLTGRSDQRYRLAQSKANGDDTVSQGELLLLGGPGGLEVSSV